MSGPEHAISNPDFYKYTGRVALLNKQPNISATDVHDLLELKRVILAIDPTRYVNDLTYVSVALDRYERGNRASLLEYVYQEAFKGDATNPIDYKNRATFWMKCAEGLIREPLCEKSHQYESLQRKIAYRRDSDPELNDCLAAALAWNQLSFDPNSSVDEIVGAYTYYLDCRAELFGPDIKP